MNMNEKATNKFGGVCVGKCAYLNTIGDEKLKKLLGVRGVYVTPDEIKNNRTRFMSMLAYLEGYQIAKAENGMNKPNNDMNQCSNEVKKIYQFDDGCDEKVLIRADENTIKAILYVLDGINAFYNYDEFKVAEVREF